MTCNCRSDIEGRLLERFKTIAPEATEHRILLTGYAMIIEELSLVEKGCWEIENTALYPLKKGGHKERKTKTNLIFTFCPFCGIKYDAD